MGDHKIAHLTHFGQNSFKLTDVVHIKRNFWRLKRGDSSMTWPMNEEDHHLLEEIQDQTLAILREVIGAGYKNVVLLDFPLHKNAGDSLIYAGEKRYISRLGLGRPYTVDSGWFDIDRLMKSLPESVVLFQGGGNLGDLWPEVQNFREAVIPLIHGKKVVILSQSIWFTDPAQAARANRIFSAHGDVTLLLRDYDSLQRSSELLPDVRALFCPDMAFGNLPFRRRRPARQPLLFLSRDDKEKKEALKSSPALTSLARVTTDWDSGMSAFHRAQWVAAKLPGRVYWKMTKARSFFERLLLVSLHFLSAINLASASRIISQGDVLITDRLHAHVFAILHGIPHVVLDNGYGKIASVFRDYSGGFTTAHYASTGEEAAKIASTLEIER